MSRGSAYLLVLRRGAARKRRSQEVAFGIPPVCVYVRNESPEGELTVTKHWCDDAQRADAKLPAGAEMLWAPVGSGPLRMRVSTHAGRCAFQLAAVVRHARFADAPLPVDFMTSR